MEFRFLNQEERDEIIVEFFKAQERDAFCHMINLQRFDDMLRKLPPGKWRDTIQTLRDQTQERLNEILSIIEATIPQLPPQERIQAALERLEKRNKTNAGGVQRT